MADNIVALLSFVLTLMVFSYVLGDLPLVGILYRVAVYILIGMTAAFTLIVTYEGLILPYLLDLQNPATSWTSLGARGDIHIFFAALLFTGLLLLKPVKQLAWLTNSVFAVLIVVGAAVAVTGALSGTLFPLLGATVPEATDLPDLLDEMLIFVGTVTALFYFHYQISARNAEAEPEGGPLRRGFRQIGKLFLVTALGAIYASALLSSLTILTERLSFLFQYGA